MIPPNTGHGTNTDRAAIDRLLRELAPQAVAVVARRHRDFDMAEDAVQEALIAASTRWVKDGLPVNPRGWLYHVALRRLTDMLRSEVARERRESAVASAVVAEWAFVPPPTAEVELEEDDTLALVYMCCHPSLTPSSAIALTLRAVAGLSTAEIAAAFMVPEATMAQRISRAKQSIRASGVPFRLPEAADRATRLDAVLHVLYLLFNEGYVSSHSDTLQRPDLAREAIRVTRLLDALVPASPEVEGLLALMLLTDARRDARTGTHGELIPLDEQDRSRWSAEQIAEGVALVSVALGRGRPGPYQLQAAIAALHDEARSVEETDWPQILALYDTLLSLGENAMVRLNRIVALSMVHGPDAALRELDVLQFEGELSGHYRPGVIRAHLLERRGERAGAAELYARAAEATPSAPERDYLRGRALRARVEGSRRDEP